MPSGIRQTLAKKICALLPRSIASTPDISMKIAWATRFSRVNKKTDSSQNQLEIHLSRLRLSKVLSDLNWKEQQEWAQTIKQRFSSDSRTSDVDFQKDKLTVSADVDYLKNQILKTIISEKGKYGLQSELHKFREISKCLQPQKENEVVVVEYSSPNIAKPFHAGHLRSTIIGNVIANLYEALGHRVVRINFLGDWGTQFGLLGVGLKTYGSETEMKSNAMKHLFDVYVQVNKDMETKVNGKEIHQEALEFFRLMEQGHEEAIATWKKCQQLSIEEYETLYKRIGTHFDRYDGESMYQTKSKSIIEDLKNRGLLQYHKDSNVAYVDLTSDSSKQFYANVQKSDGTSLYITRDVAAAIDRYDKYKFDRMHYLVDNSQHDHFLQLHSLLKKMKEPWIEEINLNEFHIKFGRVEGMSTRKGQVVFLKDILDEAKTKMIEVMKSKDTTKVKEDLEEVADQLGVSAVVIQDLKEKRQKNYQFSWERMLRFTGDTGVHLQYTHARLYSLEENCGIELNPSCSLERLTEPEALRLILHLARFDEAIHDSFVLLEPYHITRYLLSLCQLVNVANDNLKVKDQVQDLAEARLLLFHCSRHVLSTGLRLLGLKPLNKM